MKDKKSNSILVESQQSVPTQSTCSISRHTSSQTNTNLNTINNSKKVSYESQFNTQSINKTFENENKFNYDKKLSPVKRSQDNQYLNRM